MKFQMFPFPTRQDSSHLSSPNLMRHSFKNLASCVMQVVSHSPNLSNFLCCKFARPLLFPFSLSILSNHVLKVFIRASNPQVSRIYTQRIISIGAVMANHIPGPKWSKMDHPTKCVGVDNFLFGVFRKSIAFWRRNAIPQPTRFGEYDPAKEQGDVSAGNVLNLRISGITVLLHNQIVWLCHALGCINSAGALWYYRLILTKINEFPFGSASLRRAGIGRVI